MKRRVKRRNRERSTKMSERNFKTIRKQLRNVVQELIPTLLQNELVAAVDKRLTELVKSRLDKVAEYVETQMKEVQDRQKDIQTYVVQNVKTPDSTPKQLGQ
jgi:hypothetical protein